MRMLHNGEEAMDTNRKEMDNLPTEIRRGKRWIVWKKEIREDGRLTKVPYQPNRTDKRAASNRPQEWGTLAEAQAAVQDTRNELDGIGVMMYDGLCGIDIDHCIDETGALNEKGTAVTELMRTYTERSPSGTGLHLYFEANGFQFDKEKYFIKPVKEPGAGLEVYVSGATNRFLTVTGDRYGSWEFGDRSEQLQTFLDTFMLRPKPPERRPIAQDSAPVSLDSVVPIKTMMKDKAFADLWNGIRPYSDESANDMALMNKLAFWYDRDVNLMCEAFLSSPFFQSKDDYHRRKIEGRMEDYFRKTTQKAADECQKTASDGRAEYYRSVKHKLTSIPSRPDITDSGKMSFPAAISYAASLEEKPWIYADEDSGKPKYRILPMELSKFIQENVQMLFVRDSAMTETILYTYDGGHYRQISDNELKGCIRQLIPYSMRKTRDVSEVYNDLMDGLEYVNVSDLDSDENIINFENGLLRLDTMELVSHDPKVLSTIQIPCRWNPTAKLPDNSVFERYLSDLTGGDEGTKEILMEAMGLCLSNVYGYRTKKALFLVDKGDSGKTQIKELMAHLLGEENISTADLAVLCKPFGLSNIYQKRLVGSNDMSFQNVEDMMLFKQITGGDMVQVEIKYRSAFPYKFRGFCWFNTNRLPRFGGDKGEHVYNRILPICINNVIPPEKQDPTLLEKMLKEKEGIVVLAIQALKRLIANNYRFIETEAVQKARELYETENNSLFVFVEDCCERKEVPPKDRLRRSDFNRVYREWCKRNGKKALSDRDIRDGLEQLGIQKATIHGIVYLCDLCMNFETKTEFSGFCNYDSGEFSGCESYSNGF